MFYNKQVENNFKSIKTDIRKLKKSIYYLLH